MSDVGFDLVAVAATYRAVFGGSATYQRYHADDESVWVDITRAPDRPEPGVSCWATLGMSRFDTGYETGDGRALRIELVGEVSSAVETFGNMLTSCAINIASGGYGLEPDTIYPDIVAQYEPDVSTAHMLITDVFSFEGLAPVEADGQVLAFLQVVPVTDEEFRFARAEGVAALTDLLERHAVDVRDLDRPSVVGPDATDAFETTLYCERFDLARCKPVDPLTEDEARRRYAEGPAFTVVLGARKQPEPEETDEGTVQTVRPPRAVLDVDATASRVLVSALDDDLGSLVGTHLYRRRGDRLFLEQHDRYEYAAGTSEGAANVVVHEQFWFRPDGTAHRTVDDARADRISTEDRRDVPVDERPVPAFGAWDGLVLASTD